MVYLDQNSAVWVQIEYEFWHRLLFLKHLLCKTFLLRVVLQQQFQAYLIKFTYYLLNRLFGQVKISYTLMLFIVSLTKIRSYNHFPLLFQAHSINYLIFQSVINFTMYQSLLNSHVLLILKLKFPYFIFLLDLILTHLFFSLFLLFSWFGPFKM